jgi:hypothetical protein
MREEGSFRFVANAPAFSGEKKEYMTHLRGRTWNLEEIREVIWTGTMLDLSDEEPSTNPRNDLQRSRLRSTTLE